MVGFIKATKQKSKLRAAFYGPSGSGKTFTALRTATGIGGRIAFIDSERGAAKKYADRFAFDVLELGDDRSIAAYVAAMRLAADAGYDVLIIDSLSHAWQELMEEVDRLAKSKFKGNSWSAWSEGTPIQRELVDAIMRFPGHVIATMRSKTEWGTEKNSGGKNAPTRVGLAPEQGKGIEYEFDLLLSISTEHFAVVEKDRTGKFQDKTIEKPGESFGKELAAWLDDGVPAPPRVVPLSDTQKAAMKSHLAALEVSSGQKAYVESLNGGAMPETYADGEAVVAELARRVAAKTGTAAPPRIANGIGGGSSDKELTLQRLQDLL